MDKKNTTQAHNDGITSTRAPKQEKTYTVRFCWLRELNKLQQFIHDHWKEDHILSRDRQLLLWQHHTTGMDYLNFVVAVDKKTNEFMAILGFIPTYQFDINLRKEKTDHSGNDIWLAIWKKHRDHEKQIRGLDLYEYLMETLNPISVAAIGINDDVEKLYKEKLGFTTGRLQHWFYLRPKTMGLKIASAPIPKSARNDGRVYMDIPDLTKIIDQCQRNWKLNGPDKTIEYWINRYQKHPTYKYMFVGSYGEDDHLDYIFCIRKIKQNQSTCLRIIEIFDNTTLCEHPPASHELWNSLLHDEEAEYIDCIYHGDKEDMLQMDLFCKSDYPYVVIPNYFEPFVPENIEIKFAFKNFNVPVYNHYRIFKGDSDQDRPNLLMSNGERADERCCGRCMDSTCVLEAVCETHKTQGCRICWP